MKKVWNNLVNFFKSADKNNLYSLNGCVPPQRAVLFGIQHILAMFIANLAPILFVLGTIGVESEIKASVIQNAIFIAGIGTIFQLYPVWKFGGKLPIVVGVSFTFATMLSYVGLQYGYGAMLGGVIVGGIFISIMGLFAKYWIKFIKPIVSSIVILAIGLSLLSVGGDYFAGGASNTTGVLSYLSWQSLLVGLLTLIACLLFQMFVKGTWKNLSTLFGICVGYLISLCFGGVDFSSFEGVKAIALPRFAMTTIEFRWEAILPTCLIYLVATTECVGDVSALCNGGLSRDPTTKEISGALACDGLVSAVSGCFGCMPLTTFCQNVGIVSSTKIVNRFAILFGAIIMILAGLFPGISAAILTIPYPVLGGALVMLFASIVVTGFEMVAKCGFTPKNILILTLSIGVGYGFSLVPNFYSALGEVPSIILSNPVAMMFIISFILSFCIPENYGLKQSLENKENNSEKISSEKNND